METKYIATIVEFIALYRSQHSRRNGLALEYCTAYISEGVLLALHSDHLDNYNNQSSYALQIKKCIFPT